MNNQLTFIGVYSLGCEGVGARGLLCSGLNGIKRV